MAMNFQAWIDDVNGKFINVDNAYGAQCWDLAQDYLTRVLGGGSLQTGPSPHQGYAIGVWDGFGSNGLNQWFTQAPASATPQAGWVAVWKWGALPFYPLSHIAIVTRNLPGGMVNCMTQNPGPAHIQPLAKAGLAGYLVPKGMGSGAVMDTVLSPGEAVEGLVEGTGQITAIIAQLNRISGYLTQPDNWKRIGFFAMGAVMLLLTIIILLGKTPVAQTVVKELT